MKKILFIAGAFLLFMQGIAFGQALPFVAAETDALSLGKAGTDLVETGSIANSAFSNPASIVFAQQKLDAYAGYTMWQPSSVGSNMMNFGAAYNLNNKFGFAFGLMYGMNPSYDITDASGAIKGQYNPSDMRINAAFAYRLLPALSLGTSVGYASSNLAEGHSYGTLTADIFLLSEFSDFKLAAGVSNLGGGIKAASGDKFGLPTSIALGAGYAKGFAEVHRIEAALDVDYFLSGGLAASIGAGYTFNNLVSLRAGYHYGGESVIPSYASVGAGVSFAGVRLDLAYLLGSPTMNNTLALSLGYSF